MHKQSAGSGSRPELVAAVDLGSNSFHLIVARVVDGHLRMIDRLRETVRLAAGMDPDNCLSEAARTRALECLRRFGQRLHGMPPGSVRIVGTNTLRKASDARAFIAEAAEALGHPVEVIAGLEEARLIYLGVSHTLPETPERHLVVDIGGGSTELIIGHRFEALHRESLYMGCVSYSEAFFPEGRIDVERMREAMLAARLELEPVENDYVHIGWGDAVGSSGTVKAVRDVLVQMGWCKEGISATGLAKLRAELIAAGDVEKVALRGLSAERRPVLAGGVAVLSAIFEALHIEQMQVSEWALREGLLYDLVGRIRHEDVRSRSISALAERFAVDAGQANRVAATASALLRQVEVPWELEDEEASNLLGWAGQLHEIGLGIAHNQHHKHAAYVVENADLPGFSREEQQRLALLVRAHRRKFPVPAFKALPKRESLRLQRLGLLLRIAVSLHRSRSEAPSPGPKLETEGKTVRVTFPENWLTEHPLTRADLQVEARFLKAAKFTLIAE